MQRIKYMVIHFLKEPLWYKILITTTLLVSIIFSSSFFSSNPYYDGFSKLAAAIFFGALGIKMRKNRVISILFYMLTVICIYLFWNNLSTASL